MEKPIARKCEAARTRRRLTPRGLRGRGVVLPEAELVPVRVLARGEPTHGRHRHRVAGLAAELLHPPRAGLDVVDVEVGAHPVLAGLHVRDRRALLVADPGHVVLRRAGKRLELPAEERAPELLPLGGVVCRDLDVHDLAWHEGSSRFGWT